LNKQLLFSNIQNSTLHELFICRVQETPDKIALVDKDVRLTYRDLDQLTEHLANYLSRYQFHENDGVGVLLEKCYEYIVACIAILKAGGAYLHLELAYPNKFLGQIFADAAPKVVITKQKHQAKLDGHRVKTLYIDSDEWHTNDGITKKVTTSSSSVAIIGYSSGTTGQPKGIMVSHRATLYAYAKFWEEVWHIPNKDRFAYTTFITWDALSPLVMGQTGYIVPDEISFDPQRLMDFIADHQINHTFLTPSLLSCIIQTIDQQSIKQKLKSLKIVWLGGEVTTQQLVDDTLQVLPQLYLINNYGPAECFVITQGQLKANDPVTSSICSVGKVLDGMEVLILDESKQPVLPGEVGELYATGPCLADGYLNNPTLTQQKFILINHKIFYRTGDSARFLDDGRLIILGRRDGVVKIRGYNVNLLAIEEVLRQHPEVSDCVVIAYGNEGEDKYLVAYLIPTQTTSWKINPQTLNCPQISSYLETLLPFYMIPRVYIELDNFPRHPASQKLDKSQLPIPIYKQDEDEETIQVSNNSSNEQEQTIIGLIKEVLPHNHIKKSDNLFDIGLHSLLAAQLVTRIKHVFGTELSVATLYQHSTTQDLASYMKYGLNGRSNISWQQDSILPETIVPAPQSTRFSSDSQAVFLTGATGYVGLFLLANLLKVSTTIKVYCLVRSEARGSVLFKKLKFYQLWDESFKIRIIPLVGDLEKPCFGWSQQQFEQYAELIDVIFHASAWVNMVYPYSMLKASNVDGTREIIRFASTKINKALHYISTLGIFPAGNVSQYTETHQIDSLIDKLTIGYSQSKWVAEKLVWQAIEQGISTQIYRLGSIGPDRYTFLANEKDSVMMFLDICKQLRLAPAKSNWFFEYTPVDFATKSMLQIALGGCSSNPVYHIASPNLISASHLFDTMRKKGYIDQIVPFELWLEHLRNFVTQRPNSQYNMLEQRLQVVEEFLLETEVFDTTLFAQEIRKYNLTPPIIDENYLIKSRYPATLLQE